MSRDKSAGSAAAASAPSSSSAAAAQRLRHFHQGPDSTEAASATPATSAAPPVQLYRHALESVFAFLTLRELSGATAVSRLWSAAVLNMRRLEAEDHYLRSSLDLTAMCHSRLSRHVSGLFVWDGLKLSASQLALLATRLPQLHEMQCAVALPPPDEALILPPNLTKFNVDFGEHSSPNQLDAMTRALGQLSLLRDLVLRLHESVCFSFQPLHALPLLNTLLVRSYRWEEFSNAQMDELRAMPHLHTMSLNPEASSRSWMQLRRSKLLKYLRFVRMQSPQSQQPSVSELDGVLSVASRPTMGMNLPRSLSMCFPLLSRWMFEVELYPLLGVSHDMLHLVGREIRHAQATERKRLVQQQEGIASQLAQWRRARDALDPADTRELDQRAIYYSFLPFSAPPPQPSIYPSMDVAGELLLPTLDIGPGDLSPEYVQRLEDLVARGARAHLQKYIRGRKSIGDMVAEWMGERLSIGYAGYRHNRNRSDDTPGGGVQVAEEPEEPMPPAPDFALMQRFFRALFISNPPLWNHARQWDGDNVLDVLMTALLHFRRPGWWGPRRDRVHIETYRAMADLTSWLMSLMANIAAPEFYEGRWQTSREIILELATSLVANKQCDPMKGPLEALGQTHLLHELRQTRWNIIRQCAGRSSGPESEAPFQFSRASLRLNVPLTLPSLHEAHPLHFLPARNGPEDLNATAWGTSFECGTCKQQGSTCLQDSYKCRECFVQFHVSCPCSDSDFDPKTSASAVAQEESASLARTAAQPFDGPTMQTERNGLRFQALIPTDLLQLLTETDDDFGARQMQLHPLGSSSSSSASSSASASASLSLSASPSVLTLRTRHALLMRGEEGADWFSCNLSGLEEWLLLYLGSAKSRARLINLIRQPQFRRRTMRMRSFPLPLQQRSETADAAAQLLSLSSNNISSPGPHFAFPLFFALIKRRERSLLAEWLDFDSAFFSEALRSSTLIDPATGCPPLHFLLAHVRGCRQRIFELLLRFSRSALNLSFEQALPLKDRAGRSVADLLALPSNRRLKEHVDDATEASSPCALLSAADSVSVASAAASSSCALLAKALEESMQQLSFVGPSGGADDVQLHRHALESIFAFLSLAELHSVVAVSRDWSAAVGTMRFLDADLSSPSGSQLRAVCASRLARHIGSLDTSSCNRWELLPLQLITVSMTHLHTLRCKWINKGDGLVFPPRLTALDFGLAPSRVHDIDAMLAVSRLPLLQSLRLTIEADPAHLTLAPLQSLPQLQTLELHRASSGWEGEHWLSDAQIDDLRAMSHLTSLSLSFTPDPMRVPVEQMNGHLMRRLLRPPHSRSLQWQSFGRTWLWSQTCALLPALLPSLTQLRCSLDGDHVDASFFAQLPNLRDLWLQGGRVSDSIPMEQLLPALKSCVGLSKLTLIGRSWSAAHLSELLPCLTQLRELTLICTSEVDSLRFLTRRPTTHSLTHLSLHICAHPDLHTTELQHVHALKELRSLVIEHSFAEPLDKFTLMLYSQPDSPLLPKLTHFSYTTKTNDDEGD